ncbi:unnamed protein product [Rotaria sp. Silwood1]|nr:unnamed protein product [Rotaria sp. Silwood1]
MTRTGIYLLIQELNETDLNSVQRHVSKIVEELTLLLNDLRERQCLTDIQVQQMTVQRSMVQIDYLYFLPDAHQTLFAAVHVNDLCTLIPHEQLTEPLQHFLYDYVPDGQVQGLTVDSIIELVRFVLQNQYFIFDNKICRQIKGCGSGQPFNHLLANIFMFYWQQDLVKTLVHKNEIFDRYLNEMFFT